MIVIKLKHPRIVEYIDYTAIGNAMYIVMEVMDAGDLRHTCDTINNETDILYVFA